MLHKDLFIADSPLRARPVPFSAQHDRLRYLPEALQESGQPEDPQGGPSFRDGDRMCYLRL